MPILESKAEQTARQRILLIAGLGTVLGFQCWVLARYGFGVAIPWYGTIWILVGHALLGLGAVVTVGSIRWWQRGVMLGLLLSIPFALGASATGQKCVPQGVAVLAWGLAVGCLLAGLADALVARLPASVERKFAVSERSGEAVRAQFEKGHGAPVWRRLSEEMACLEQLALERKRRNDPEFGKATEDRMIWGELLELELEAIDEQINLTGRAAHNERRFL